MHGSTNPKWFRNALRVTVLGLVSAVLSSCVAIPL
jgi:hypothetical protein